MGGGAIESTTFSQVNSMSKFFAVRESLIVE
jgi:hypothetical protein